MAKLIINIETASNPTTQGIGVEMATTIAPAGQRTLTDAVIMQLAELVKTALPQLTKELVESSGQTVINTAITKGQSLDELMAKTTAKTTAKTATKTTKIH